jgi:sporulation protein YlmC with PRC-barrel domain
MDIPLNAEVRCADGPGGRSTYVVLHPKTRRVTHLVVREPGFPHTEWLVPVDQVAEATPTTIQLRCTRHELQLLEPFLEADYIEGDGPYASYPAGAWVIDPVIWLPPEHENIPAGELAVRRGARVDATDGHVGRVDEFLIDPASGRITHLVLREGHLWGQKEVTIPVGQIDRIDEDTIHLKLNKQSIADLPAVPLRRGRR